METTEYSISDLANAFPDMSKNDFGKLVDSVRQLGLLDPITVWRGEVIDGRHRYAACMEAGVRPRNLAGNPDSLQAVVFLTSIIDVIVGY